MARDYLNTTENSFINGLITEATGLNFPEKACTECDNCIFDDTGRVHRRLGIDFEDNYINHFCNKEDAAIATYEWRNVAGDANLTFFVRQVGSVLYFYDASSYANVSLGEFATGIDLSAHVPLGAPSPKGKECQFDSGHGVLFVFHPTLQPFYVEYDADTAFFTSHAIDISIRDFEGEEDGLAVDERPTFSMLGISDKHHYNLRNQGWTLDNLNVWDAARADLPSNADIMWTFKNADDEFDITTVANVMAGNSPAPKGHFLLDLFNQDRSDVSGIGNLTTTSTGYSRPSTGAFFAGRVFFSGLDAQKFKGKIYFSPIIERFSQFGQCYQINDPSSEVMSDLLPSDGGVIDIPDAGTIVKLVPIQSSLLVFSNNGVWAITGSDGIGFAATNVAVQKIAEIPALSATSFVRVAGYPMWWNSDGIYVIEASQNGLSPRSLTNKTIKKFYDQIPVSSKTYARGAYNKLDKTVEWVYRATEATDIETTYQFNRILRLNLNTGSFAPQSFEYNFGPYIHGIYFGENISDGVTVEEVVDDEGEPVLDEAGEQVVIYSKDGAVFSRYVYLVSNTSQFTTFATMRDTNYLDYVTVTLDGFDYTSHFTTGYKLHGEAVRKFQTNYMYVYVDREDSLGNLVDPEFFIRSKWDFTNASDTGRWSTNQRLVFNEDNGRDYEKKRIKLRGHGVAVQFQVNSVTSKPFGVIGWGLFESTNKWV